MKDQQAYNILIALELLDYIMEHPEMRFIQILWALGVADGTDLFYEPSKKTLDKIKARKDLKCLKGD